LTSHSLVGDISRKEKKKFQISETGIGAAGDSRIILGCDVHGSVFESGNIVGKLSNEFGR
jgi:hypothetical protein